jgi:hypothetical protein
MSLLADREDVAPLRISAPPVYVASTVMPRSSSASSYKIEGGPAALSLMVMLSL